MRTDDLCALGALTLPTRDLIAILLNRPHRADDDELGAAEGALGLVGPARDAALRGLHAGPRLMAAVELGRRAWMLPAPTGRRIHAPIDVAAAVAPRSHDDDEMVWTLSLDVRLTLARLERTESAPGQILRSTLGAGCQRVVVAVRRPTRAVPTSDDEVAAMRLAGAAALVGVSLVDVVLLGDDGFCSLVRLGLLPGGDARYR